MSTTVHERNEEMVEGINPDDELHQVICALVCGKGRGTPTAIIWDQHNDLKVRVMTGIVVSQCQYGQVSYRFSVTYDNDYFKLSMLRSTKTCKTDYFAP